MQKSDLKSKMLILDLSPESEMVADYIYKKHRAHFTDQCPSPMENGYILSSNRNVTVMKNLIKKAFKKFPNSTGNIECRKYHFHK